MLLVAGRIIGYLYAAMAMVNVTSIIYGTQENNRTSSGEIDVCSLIQSRHIPERA